MSTRKCGAFMMQVGLQSYLAKFLTLLSWRMLLHQIWWSPLVIWQCLLDSARAAVVISIVTFELRLPCSRWCCSHTWQWYSDHSARARANM